MEVVHNNNKIHIKIKKAFIGGKIEMWLPLLG